jgi:hypothetical protein
MSERCNIMCNLTRGSKCRALRTTTFRIFRLSGYKGDKSWRAAPDLSIELADEVAAVATKSHWR